MRQIRNAMQVNDNQPADGRIPELFFALIRCGIGTADTLPHQPTAKEWEELLDVSQKQAVVGIAYSGIERLPKEQHPPKQILISFFQASEAIRESNIRNNRISAAVSRKFAEDGFPCTILKGQGIAQLYPDPYRRTPGDTDIWLDGKSGRILNYVRKYFPACTPTYHHVNFPIKKGVDIEIHFTPSWMHNPFRNRRLQKFFTRESARQFSNIIATAEGNFPAPTLEFNRIYILLHIFRHIFQEGIGLRQLIDYYFVLDKGITPAEKAECKRMLKALGLSRFAAATMYMLKEQLGLAEEKLLLKPDVRRGKFLLTEIMIAGNFGKYDSRYAIVPKENELRHFLNSMQRTARLVSQYPSEAIWSPYFKAWHFFWRKHHSK